MILSVFGTGHMGQALVRGLLQKKAVMPQQVRLFDADQAKAAEFAASVGACHSLTSRQTVSGAAGLASAGYETAAGLHRGRGQPQPATPTGRTGSGSCPCDAQHPGPGRCRRQCCLFFRC